MDETEPLFEVAHVFLRRNICEVWKYLEYMVGRSSNPRLYSVMIVVFNLFLPDNIASCSEL